MNIEVYFIAFNESETIHLTISHYQKFASKIIVFDNYSTDNTVSIAKGMGCEVRSFGIKGILSDDEYVNVKNNAWKGSKADWVIVCDADEIIWHPNILEILHKNKGISIMKTYGWQIMSHEMPVDNWLNINHGFHYENYSKFAVFNPKLLTEINYVVGCHVARPRGVVTYSEDQLYLFHYSNVGGPERLVKKHALYRPRLSERNKRFGMGIHYTYTDEKRIAEWHERFNRSSNFSQELIFTSQPGTTL